MMRNRTLTSRATIGAALALVLGGLAGNMVSADTAPVDKMEHAALGRLDALLTLCSKADPNHKQTYEQYRTEMIEFDTGNEMLKVDGSDSGEYKAAYNEITAAAGKAPPGEMTKQCVRAFGFQADERK